MPEVEDFEPGSGWRRTKLATERTLLAWWRTGFAAILVGVGIGRLVPELSDASDTWPYTVLGVLFALYGLALIVVGSRRISTVDDALERDRYYEIGDRTMKALTGAGIALALLTALLIAVG